MQIEPLLEKINSLTKYPSIPTYHKMGDKGRLQEELNVDFSGESEIVVTEKVDGTNGRLIIYPFDSDWMIGSREELLHHSGDNLFNPSQGIVEAVSNGIPYGVSAPSSTLITYYFEVYGHPRSGNSAKNYSSTGVSGLRLFDVSLLPASEMYAMSKLDPEVIALWREKGGQHFAPAEHVDGYSRGTIESVPVIYTDKPPHSIKDTHEWLSDVIKVSMVTLDKDAPGKPEGVVIRTPDRSKIAKIRFEDYKRTLR